LFSGGMHGSVYKQLCIKIVMSWCLFPIWWVFSNEGAAVVTSYEINTLVTAAINIFAKGVYVVFVQRIHSRYIGSDDLMQQPAKHTHVEQDALFMVARLGPNGALEQMIKDEQRHEESMAYVLKVIADMPTQATMSLSPREKSPSPSPRQNCSEESAAYLPRRMMTYIRKFNEDMPAKATPHEQTPSASPREIRKESKDSNFTQDSTAASTPNSHTEGGHGGIALPAVELQMPFDKQADWSTPDQSLGQFPPRVHAEGRNGNGAVVSPSGDAVDSCGDIDDAVDAVDGSARCLP